MPNSSYQIRGKKLTQHQIDEVIDPDFVELIDFDRSLFIDTTSNRGDGYELHNVQVDEFHHVHFRFEDNGVWSLNSEQYFELIAKEENRNDGISYILPYFDSNSRSVDFIKQKIICFIKTRKITKDVAKWFILKLENFKIGREGVYKLNRDGGRECWLDEGQIISHNKKPICLLLHGTYSSGEGSFSELFGTPEWQRLVEVYDDRIYAFNHFTLTKSVGENIKMLLEYFNPDEIQHIDIISFSRGGLLGDVLCGLSSHNQLRSKQNTNRLDLCLRNLVPELFESNSERDVITSLAGGIRVDRHVRVACPAYGTSLLSESLDVFVKTVFGGVGGLIDVGNVYGRYMLGFEIVTRVIVESRYEKDVLPGLLNMIQDSEFQQALNSGCQSNDTLVVIAGHATSSPLAGSVKLLLDLWLMKFEHDLVVDTSSMTKGLRRGENGYYKLLSGPKVFHTSYFKNDHSRKFIIDGLLESKHKLLTVFDPIDESSEISNRGISLNYGKTRKNDENYKGDKPYLILLPGIMGTTFDHEDKHLWVNLFNLITGGIGELDPANDFNIKDFRAVGKSYAHFVSYFDQFFHVNVFGFDWRQPVSQAGDRLQSYIQDIVEKRKDIKVYVVAHSQGGLVIRDAVARRPAILKNIEKVILCGTPWNGSYLIPQVLMGDGARYKQLRKLSFFSHTRLELLKLLVKFEGALDLLPNYGSHNLLNYNTWNQLKKDLGDKDFAVPSKKSINRFASYQKWWRKHFETQFLDKFHYIAGYSPKTVDGINVSDDNVSFEKCKEGDGSVTWKSGIPIDMHLDQVHYCNIEHGDLLNKKHLFPSIRGILLGQKYDESILFSDRAVMISAIMNSTNRGGIPVANIYNFQYHNNVTDHIYAGLLNTTSELKEDFRYSRPIMVNILCGHLKYSKYPVAVGHFYDDGIVSAEKEINYLLSNELNLRNNMQIYPGTIGTSFFVRSDDADFKGALVIGLGDKEEFDKNKLESTVEKGVLRYLIDSRELREEDPTQNGITFLLIGSGYAGLSVEYSVLGILNGVRRANITYEMSNTSIDGNFVGLSKVEFVELFQPKAERARSALKGMSEKLLKNNIVFIPEIDKTEGRREYIYHHNDYSWWNLLRVNRKDENDKTVLEYYSSSNKARVPVDRNRGDIDFAERIFTKIGQKTTWNDRTLFSAFSIILSPQIKQWLASNNHVELRLDHATASYPWELLLISLDDEEPYSLKHQIARKLEMNRAHGEYSLTTPNYIRENTITIIADPVLSIVKPKKPAYDESSRFSQLRQLDGAREEGFNVLKLFEEVNSSVEGNSKGWQIFNLINKNPEETRTEFQLSPAKILHVACHGAYNYGDSEGFGIVFDYGMSISRSTVLNMGYIPELLFLNCCHSGSFQIAENGASTLEFAASAGLTFIKKGVRVAIVTAWEVDDKVASDFANTFYKQLLIGKNASSAFQKAKECVYYKYPGNMTWAAYQFYGDYFYTITNSDSSNGISTHYKTENDAIVDIEYWITVCSSARHRHLKRSRIKTNLDDLLKATKYSGVSSVRSLSMIAEAYKDLAYAEDAILVYEELFKGTDVSYPAKAVNNYRYLKSKQIANKEITSDSDVAVVKGICNSFDGIHCFLRSTKVLTYKASCLKSSILIYIKNGDNDENEDEKVVKVKLLLKELQLCYSEILRLNSFNLDRENSINAATNWMIFEVLCGRDVTKNKMHDLSNEKFDRIALESRFRNKKKFDSLKTFWNDIALVNIGHAMVVNGNSSNVESNRLLTQELYDKAWKRGGSYRHLQSEIDFVNFILRVNELLNKLPQYVVKELTELLKFYQKKRSKYYV